MNMSSYPHARRRLYGAALLALLTGGAVHAQTPATTPTTPAPAEKAASDDDSIMLSPFTIEAETDSEGYRAKTTLAGTRLRTELKDVGSAISVVTKEFLRDTGATSNESLLTYTTNTEVGGTRGNFAGTGNGRELNESNALLRPNSNTRVRGLAAADNTRDYFLTDIPWDGYNVSRVDMQRGPNAILFGMGSPAGIINNSTNQGTFKDENRIEFRFDNEGGTRAVADFNKAILPNELGLRIAGVTEDLKYRQKPAFSRDDRLFAALRYDPAFLRKNGMATSFRVNYEKGDGHSNRPRNLTPTDNVSAWWTNLNRLTIDPRQAWTSTGARNFRISGGDQNGQLNPNYNPWLADYGNIFGGPVAVFQPGADTQSKFGTMDASGYWGLGQNATVDSSLLSEAQRNNYFGIGGPAGAWDKGIGGIPFSRSVGVGNFAGWASSVANPTNPERQGLDAALIGAYRNRAITDPGIFDFYNNLLDGDSKREWRDFEAANFNVSQTFFDNRLGFEGVYDKQRYSDGQFYGVRQALYMDINTVGLDGVTNPNVGKAFVQHDNGGQEFMSQSEASRITGFGEFRASDVLDQGWLASLLGRHVVTGMYADEERETRQLSFMRYAMDPRYTFEVTGADVNGNKLGSRGLTQVSYLSGDLRGTTSANQANLAPVQGTRVPSISNGVYRFDSHWARPINPADPGYVNPAAPWIDTGGGTSTEAENPANYKGWGTYQAGDILSYEDGDAGELYTNGLATYRRVKSQAFIWQAYLFDGTLVPTVGWRKDEFQGAQRGAPRDAAEKVTDRNFLVDQSTLPDADAGESLSYSLVLHTPQRIKAKMPLQTNVSVFYNSSENFQPRPGEIDLFGDTLANPTGETKDYGFTISTLNDRLSLKVNWYETNVTNDRITGFEFWRIPGTVSTLLTSASRVRNKDMSPGADWRWNYSQWTANGGQPRADQGAQLVLDAYNNNPVVKNFINSWDMAQFVNAQDGSIFNTPPGTNATVDTTSKGIEFELFARPLDGWDVSFNASKTSATQNNIGGALKQWIEAMDPLFQGPAGDLRQWWSGDSNTMRQVWNGEVMSQFNRLKAQEGQDVPELRKWRFNFVNNYRFNSGILKGSNLGIAYRWEDSIVIGYPVINRPNAITGLTESVYDVANPYRGPSEDHVDLWVGYERRLTSKINWRIQLNVRDILAKKELVPISVQPDGSPAAYRIPELTTWSITNTLTF